MKVISLVSWLLLEIVEAICCLVKLARNCAQICLIILKGKILPSCPPYLRVDQGAVHKQCRLKKRQFMTPLPNDFSIEGVFFSWLLLWF